MERAFRIIRPTFTSSVKLCQRGFPELSLANNGKPNLALVRQMVSSFTSEGKNEMLSSNVIAQLRSAQRSEDILTLVQANELNGNQASIALSALRNSNLFADEEKCDLPNDERFVSLLGTIAADLKKLSSESLVNSIINMFKLQQAESPIMTFLETECRHRLRGMAVRHLVLLVCNTRLLLEHSQSSLLAQEALRVLELRWKEMNNPFLLKKLLKTSLHISASFVEKLEDKAVDMIDNFSFQDLVDISSYFASSRHRPSLVFRAISHQVDEQQSQWEVSQLLKLMNNMRISKFNNYLFFKDVASFCKEHLREFSSRQIAEVVKCFGLLRMPEPRLCDAVLDHLKSHMTEFKLSELQTVAFGLSVLNLKPPTQLVKRLICEFQSLRFPQQVEVCLALAVFDACPAEQLKTLMETKSVDEIMGSRKPWHIPLQLKLLHLNTYAKVECQSYKGPLLSEGYVKYPKPENPTKSNLHLDVIGRLEATLRNEKYFVSPVGLESGYMIDAEIVVDKHGVPLSNIDYNVSSDLRDHSSLCKDLPENSLRVALIVNGPNNYLHGCSELTGRRQMMVRMLQALKYHLIQIPFEDWNKMKTDSKKVEYLKKKMDGIVTLK